MSIKETATAADQILAYCKDTLGISEECTAYATAIALRSLTQDAGIAQSILDQVNNNVADAESQANINRQ